MIIYCVNRFSITLSKNSSPTPFTLLSISENSFNLLIGSENNFFYLAYGKLHEHSAAANIVEQKIIDSFIEQISTNFDKFRFPFLFMIVLKTKMRNIAVKKFEAAVFFPKNSLPSNHVLQSIPKFL